MNGVKTRVEKLCQAFENGKELVELSQASPHDISNVLKLYLRQVNLTGLEQSRCWVRGVASVRWAGLVPCRRGADVGMGSRQDLAGPGPMIPDLLVAASRAAHLLPPLP